jgi:DNA-binding CsgD family transcriptional regulator
MASDKSSIAERLEESEPVYALWDDLADFGAHEIDPALRHCMRSIGGLIGADDAGWCGWVRLDGLSRPEKGVPMGSKYDLGKGDPAQTDRLDGWRIGAIVRLNPLDPDTERRRYQAIQNLEEIADDTIRALISRAGHFRAYTLRGGVVDLAEYSKTEQYDLYFRKPGISDRLWVVFPVTSDSESFFVFDRYDENCPFTHREVSVAKRCLRGIKWFHRQVLLSHGIGISDTTLTPTERRVLTCLLTGHSEKQLADKLGMKQGTVHQYCVCIYRKYGVRGRLELMSLWLNPFAPARE